MFQITLSFIKLSYFVIISPKGGEIMNNDFSKLSDVLKGFSIDIPKMPTLELPQIETPRLNMIPTASNLDLILPKYEEDCPAISVCKAVKEECRKGATAHINSRCSGAEVHNVLTKYNNQTINFNGNVTQFSQGDNNQLTIQNQLPPELINRKDEILDFLIKPVVDGHLIKNAECIRESHKYIFTIFYECRWLLKIQNVSHKRS